MQHRFDPRVMLSPVEIHFQIVMGSVERKEHPAYTQR